MIDLPTQLLLLSSAFHRLAVVELSVAGETQVQVQTKAGFS